MRTATMDEDAAVIAGLAGRTVQAVNEAQVARDLGYHAGCFRSPP